MVWLTGECGLREFARGQAEKSQEAHSANFETRNFVKFTASGQTVFEMLIAR
jgi:hypothetical protein